MIVKPLCLEEMTAEHAQMLNRIVGSRRIAEAQIGGECLTLMFAAKSAVQNFELAIKLRVGDSTAWIALAGLDRLSAIQEILGDSRLVELPNEVQAAVVETTFEPILDAIERVVGMQLDIAETTSPNAVENVEEQFYFVANQNVGPAIHGCLFLPVDLLEPLMAIVARLKPVRCNNLAEIPIVGIAKIGSCKMPLRELRAIMPFDVAIMDDDCPDADVANACKTVHLEFSPALTCKARLEESFLAIERIEQPLHAPKPAEVSDLGVPFANADELEVDLTFSLGELRVPLKDLISLQPGKTLPFPPERRQSCILAAGQPLGFGEFVSVGTRMGMRLLHSTQNYTSPETPPKAFSSLQAEILFSE